MYYPCSAVTRWDEPITPPQNYSDMADAEEAAPMDDDDKKRRRSSSSSTRIRYFVTSSGILRILHGMAKFTCEAAAPVVARHQQQEPPHSQQQLRITWEES